MAAWPPTIDDFYTFGLPAAACVPEERVVSSIDLATSTFVLPTHGYANGALVQLAPKGTGATLPAPASVASVYTVRRLGAHIFQLVGLTLSALGTGLVHVLEDAEPKILKILAGCASDVQARYTAGRGPWADAPPWAVRRACHLAAADVATWLRVASPLYDMEKILARAAAADAFLTKLEGGMPTAEPPVDATPTVYEMAPVAVPLRSAGSFDLPGDGGDIA